VNLRLRDGEVPGAMPVDAFLTLAQEAVTEKRLL
jgi:hypothetical protein